MRQAFDVGRRQVRPIQPVEIRTTRRATADNTLINQSLGRPADSVFRAARHQLVEAATAELFVGSGEHAQDIPIEAWA